jgi:hypothetical protein
MTAGGRSPFWFFSGDQASRRWRPAAIANRRWHGGRRIEPADRRILCRFYVQQVDSWHQLSPDTEPAILLGRESI